MGETAISVSRRRRAAEQAAVEVTAPTVANCVELMQDLNWATAAVEVTIEVLYTVKVGRKLWKMPFAWGSDDSK